MIRNGNDPWFLLRRRQLRFAVVEEAEFQVKSSGGISFRETRKRGSRANRAKGRGIHVLLFPVVTHTFHVKIQYPYGCEFIDSVIPFPTHTEVGRRPSRVKWWKRARRNGMHRTSHKGRPRCRHNWCQNRAVVDERGQFATTQTTKLNSVSSKRPVIFQQPSVGMPIPTMMYGGLAVTALACASSGGAGASRRSPVTFSIGPSRWGSLCQS
jgi:hypothetical protein